MRFSPVQQQAIDIRDKNVLVFASAGSGKTSVLVERLCQLVLKDKISIDSILAMTFTNDAAMEMKTRLKISLEKEKDDPYIQEQLALLEDASICTIDSFCLGIVQQYYYRIPISYKMAKSIETSATALVFHEAYQKARESINAKDLADLDSFFSDYSKSITDQEKYIQNLINTAWAKPDPKTWITSLYQEDSSEIETWFITYFKQIIESMLMVLEDFPEGVEEKEEKLQQCLEDLKDNDYESFRRDFLFYITTTPRLKNKYDDIDTSKENKAFKELEKKIGDVLFPFEVFEKEKADSKQRKKLFCQLALLTQKYYAQLKKEKEVLDFGDMEHFAYQLLCQEDIAKEVKEKYQMILVDEFQDTNDLQESILACFARKDNVFRVGDIKQSIYGFRYAKPEIMKNHMNSQDEHSCVLILNENYRSNDSIIRFNNDFYEKIMNVSGMERQFEQKDIAMAGTNRQKEQKQYPVRFLYNEYETFSQQEEEKAQSARSLCNELRLDMIAQDILKHHEQGIPYKDICILTRSHTPQEKIKKALEAYQIPVLAEIDHGFYTNHSVQITMACLKAIQDPTDDIALCSLLFSPLVSVSTDALAQACIHKEKGASLFDTVKEEPFMDSFKEMRTWRKDPLCDQIRKIYAKNDFYMLHTTAQDKINLDLFLQLASQADDPLDPLAFLDQHNNAAKLDRLGEAYPYGKDADVVSIKTMHHSKGLQFPVVYIYSQHETKNHYDNQPVLIDDTLGLALGQIDPYGNVRYPGKDMIAIKTKKMQDDLQEEMRVFYVATTRAEKELIIVDSIKSASSYNDTLSLYTLLKRQSYTSWLFYTYYHSQSDLIRFERDNTYYKRPETKRISQKPEPKKVYELPVYTISTKTASMAKEKIKWKKPDLKGSKGARRGTLFHEAVASLSFPYQPADLKDFGQAHQYPFRDTDIEQILSLNQDPLYRQCMSHAHQFECPYLIKEENSLIHGFMDLVSFMEDKIVILDFKTDHLETDEEFIETYKEQLVTYKNSLSKIESKPIETWIYSFYKQKMIPIQ